MASEPSRSSEVGNLTSLTTRSVMRVIRRILAHGIDQRREGGRHEMTSRRLPRWRDVKPLLGGGAPRRNALEAALTIDDLRDLARRRTPRPVFDYTDGGAEEERCMRRARDAFDAVVFHPHV